jgi:hypothetical protein
MRFPSEGPMPRHLRNVNHWDRQARPAGADQGTRDIGHALRGRRGEVMVTRERDPVKCKRCLAAMQKKERA